MTVFNVPVTVQIEAQSAEEASQLALSFMEYAQDVSNDDGAVQACLVAPGPEISAGGRAVPQGSTDQHDRQGRGYFASLVDAGASSDRDASIKAGYLKEGEPYYQLQKDDDAGLFDDDKAAITAAVRDATTGDRYALAQLRIARTDALVRGHLNDALKHLASIIDD